jgi:hypothetical protein
MKFNIDFINNIRRIHSMISVFTQATPVPATPVPVQKEAPAAPVAPVAPVAPQVAPEEKVNIYYNGIKKAHGDAHLLTAPKSYVGDEASRDSCSSVIRLQQEQPDRVSESAKANADLKPLDQAFYVTVDQPGKIVVYKTQY